MSDHVNAYIRESHKRRKEKSLFVHYPDLTLPVNTDFCLLYVRMSDAVLVKVPNGINRKITHKAVDTLDFSFH